MKRFFILGMLPLGIIIVLASLWALYTHNGRVVSLYAFAAFKAPLATKVDCIKTSNQEVQNKFAAPLKFDESAKDSLREFWHFSYYRACLFEAGYDFYGNKLGKTELVQKGDLYQYKNPVAGVSFLVPNDTVMALTNAINPDLDDYLIASELRVGNDDVFVYTDRSYKVDNMASLAEAYAGFEAHKGVRSDTLAPVQNTASSSNMSAYEDGNFYGYVILFPNSHIVKLFGDRSAKKTIDAMAASYAAEAAKKQ
jgi:hypothetical protein